ncbi:MAG: HAMP domain-containing sensor histidine kinase [Tateyamaria sp.]|nr:HAMP domain-containing sensor histidine kinase [Tateyamaria sp.]MDG1421868.1 HAMP domain-containing sensor histidine kinase [Tateyamaria sp.]MDG1679290.1 HAMP domain-containing sensor histidine kinase [Tateyamaria sp.]MDG2379625.1 HAMP domain-containing sensor histidine kinase [Tateyamaria sp.]
MINSLSGRFLILTTIFVMLAEILIFVPSIARFREEYLQNRLERAQIASLALLADDMLDSELEQELLENAGVFNVVLRRDEVRQLMLSTPVPRPIDATYDLRKGTAPVLIRDAITRLIEADNEVIRVIGAPVREAGLLIEVTMETAPLREAMIDYGVRILVLSAVISIVTALLLFLVVRAILVKPIRGVVGHMQLYAAAPEDVRGIITPSAKVTELREAEEALRSLQTDMIHALRQKDRLAQLGSAVSKISHDLRNILTSAQLFTDRIETSKDPLVARMAPKLVNSITRAVHLCESTLAFGKAEEPSPTLTMMTLDELVADVLDSERLAVGDYDLKLSENIPPLLALRADPEQLFRVVSNLVRNARQAIVASGKSGEICVSAYEDDDNWWIEVMDTGPGLPAKAQKHLFAPFQGGVSKGGTGLGLAIASELVRGHGGALELDRTGAKGTVFSVRLPKGDGI